MKTDKNEKNKCGACGFENTVGKFRNDERNLEVYLCEVCKNSATLNGFIVVPEAGIQAPEVVILEDQVIELVMRELSKLDRLTAIHTIECIREEMDIVYEALTQGTYL